MAGERDAEWVRGALHAAGIAAGDDVGAAVTEHVALLAGYARQLEAHAEEAPEPAPVFRA